MLLIDKNLRQVPRRRVRYPAWIDIGDGSALRDCYIRDISMIGASLTIGAQDDIPEEFTLVLAKGTGMGRRCRVVRRSEQLIAVTFHKPLTTIRSPNRMLEKSEEAIEQLDC